MSDADLTALAEAAGIAPRWRDVHGGWHDVAPQTLRAVLGALGLPADGDSAVRDSLASVRQQAAGRDDARRGAAAGG